MFRVGGQACAARTESTAGMSSACAPPGTSDCLLVVYPPFSAAATAAVISSSEVLSAVSRTLGFRV